MSGVAGRVSSTFNRWLAPELLADKKPTFLSDVYSLSVVLCEAASGQYLIISTRANSLLVNEQARRALTFKARLVRVVHCRPFE